MTAAVTATNMLLGVAYIGFGIMTLLDMKREWKTVGFSHFGAAWVTLAFTCGPHHLAHGIHVGFEGRTAGGADLAAVAIGLPMGVIFLWLRVEAFFGRRGDRFISGTPAWISLAPVAAGAYASAVVMWAVGEGGKQLRMPSLMTPNLLLIVIYLAIGSFLLRTQLRNREPLGGWSVSGLSLSGVFPTCAVMHGVWVLYAATGQYAFDSHGLVIDWLSIPAALYYLSVVRRLYREVLTEMALPAAMPEPARAGAR